MTFNSYTAPKGTGTASADAEDTRDLDPGAVDSLLNRTRKATPPTDRYKSMAHPRDVPWTKGQPGYYDGTYIVEFTGMHLRETRARKPMVKTSFRIVEIESRPEADPRLVGPVIEGTEREHVIWPESADAAYGEFQQCLQDRAQFLRGVTGQYSDEEAKALLGPGQPLNGTRARLVVHTRPQRDPTKCFTDHRWTLLSRAEDRLEAAVEASMPAPTPEQIEAWRSGGFIPPEAA